MPKHAHLRNLLGAYFHQDHLEVTGNEVQTVDAYCRENPGHVLPLASELHILLGSGASEADLAAFADAASCDIDPRYDGGTYRQWFTEIEAQARAYAAEHPET